MNPVLVALDFPNSNQALDTARVVAPHVGGFKVGLELLLGEGPGVINRIAEFGAPVFVDAKLHDIPNTVAGAARMLGERGARWITVHGLGGSEMIQAAVGGLEEGSKGRAELVSVRKSGAQRSARHQRSSPRSPQGSPGPGLRP